MKKILFIALSIIMIVGILLGGCNEPAPTPAPTPAPAPAPVEPKTLEIGVLTDLSGFLSVYYLQQVDEMLIEAKLINERGGLTIQGQKYNVKLVLEDAKSGPDGAAAGATKLVFDDKVKFVIGPIGFEAAASTPIFEENKVINVNCYPMFSPGELNANTPYSFAGNEGILGYSMVMFQALKKFYPDVKTVVYTAADDGSISNMEPRFNSILTNMGYTLLNDGKIIAFPNSMEDLSPIAAKINSLKPDGVIMTSAQPPQATGFIKALRMLGYNGPFVFPGGMGAQMFLDVLGPTADKIATMGTTLNSPLNPPLLAELQAKMGETPVMGNLSNCLIILTGVIQKANSLDVDAVKAAWESSETMEGLYGTVIFSGDQTYGLPNHAVSGSESVQALENGKIVDKGFISTGPIP